MCPLFLDDIDVFLASHIYLLWGTRTQETSACSRLCSALPRGRDGMGVWELLYQPSSGRRCTFFAAFFLAEVIYCIGILPTFYCPDSQGHSAKPRSRSKGSNIATFRIWSPCLTSHDYTAQTGYPKFNVNLRCNTTLGLLNSRALPQGRAEQFLGRKLQRGFGAMAWCFHVSRNAKSFGTGR